MDKLRIELYNEAIKNKVFIFLKSIYLENKNHFELKEKNFDINDIVNICYKNGNFWLLKSNKKIVGSIGMQQSNGFYEIKTFYILRKYQDKNYGKSLLLTAIKYALGINCKKIRLSTYKNCDALHHILKEFGFYQIHENKEDFLWQYDVTETNIFKIMFKIAKDNIVESLVLNPTENFPHYIYDTSVFEGLYISERHKNKNDIVIFGGRDDAINLYDFTKELWKKYLNADGVDLKTFSGLNAHLIFFLCFAKRNDKVLILPEIAGGHFATEMILKKIGLKVEHLKVNIKNKSVDVDQSLAFIKEFKPDFIFVDRSEGFVYEDFKWLAKVTNCIKVFDASQYLTQIITNYYENPLQFGFDYLISTLHKNYPGPQKCLIAAKQSNETWKHFLDESKTFISNNHPENIIKSIIPLLDFEKLCSYSNICLKCCALLYNELLLQGLPVVRRNNDEKPTLHIWIRLKNKNDAYKFFLKLEQVHIYTNYRKLPYNLGYGLRLGVGAAVNQGLRPNHIHSLAKLIGQVYNSNEINNNIIRQAKYLIKDIIAK